eukprot:TRINITY_DN2685_c0_g1_i1.p1 TRINITY_DN2685_c0_g1~~TRINITY_DN2685_c0_g1_i1.p1  ORF type:complete len:269 (+),score=59.53 TRINITY_DN2685_c0_g1_i1:67-873(+)
MTSSGDVWESSLLGDVIVWMSEEVMLQVNRLFAVYAGCNDSKSRDIWRGLSAQRPDKIKPHRGQLDIPASTLSLLVRMQKEYFRTGRIEVTEKTPRKVCSNPTFFCFSETNKLHYMLFPISSFFIENAILEEGESQLNQSNIIRSCLSQFSDYISVLRSQKTNIKLELFLGDALDCCEILSSVKEYHTFYNVRQYTKPIEIRQDICSVFDVIYTSNLSDHLGVWNIFTHTEPLLKDVPYVVLLNDSMIYTGTIKEYVETVFGIDPELV